MTAIPDRPTRRTTVWRDQFRAILDPRVFLACPACGAAVDPRHAQQHADWHNGSGDPRG